MLPSTEPLEQDQRVVEELLRALVKGQRALQMYLPNNPMYQRAVEQVAEAFAPVWSVTGRLVLDIEESAILWEGVPVFRQPARQDGFASQLYKDGLRRLTLLPGVESDEITRLMDVLNRARLLPADAGDDLLTLLWEQEFVLVSYAFVEMVGEGHALWQERGGSGSGGLGDDRDQPGQGGGGARAAETADAVRREVESDQGGGAPGTVDLSDYDSTLHFLDEAEHRLIRSDLDEEYRRDIRAAAIDALLDILEARRDPAVRRECVALLEEIVPSQLATGGFRSVAHMLRELRVIAVRGPGLDQALREAILSFEERLSRPDILEQMVRALEDSATRPSEEEVTEVLRELKPAALPTLLVHLGRTLDPVMRRMLEPSVEQLARNEPQLLARVLDDGPEEAIAPAMALAARLGLLQLVPSVARYLQDPSPATRIAAVRAMGTFGTPTAVSALEVALDDGDRAVRQSALEALLARGGSAGALQRLEKMIFASSADWDRTERKTLFEAWGQLSGPSGIERMQDLLEPKGLFKRKQPPEVRACALFALAKIRTMDARVVVDRYTRDGEPVVRSAANTVLRDWTL